MKNPIILLIVLILISENAAAQNYGLGNADPALFGKYKIPETNLSSLWFNSSFQFHNNESDDNYSFAQHSVNSSNTNIACSLAPQYYLLKENDDRFISLNVTAQGSYNYSYQKLIQDSTSSSKENADALVLDGSGRYNNYFGKDNLFYSARSEFHVYTRDNRLNGSYDNYKRQEYALSFGIGWGKIRNVTPVVSAIRFQERLKQLNLLNNDLSEKTIEDLAEQFSKSVYYNEIHDRAEKYFWQDIEKILNKNGVSLNGINQYGTYYLRETLDEVRFIRNEGDAAGVNLKLNYTNTYSTESNSQSMLFEELYLEGNVYFNFSHQLNLDSQIHGLLSFSGGPNLTEKSNIKQIYDVKAILGYDYELTDRLVTSIYDEFDLSFTNFGGQNKLTANQLNLSMSYFVEDNYSLNATYNWNYSFSKYSTYEKRNLSSNNFQIGFTYYIGRGFLYN